MPRPDDIERCLAVLEETGVANAGGVWGIRLGAEVWLARAIVAAASNPIEAVGRILVERNVFGSTHNMS